LALPTSPDVPPAFVQIVGVYFEIESFVSVSVIGPGKKHASIAEGSLYGGSRYTG
jgi:hypothetical protein